MARVSPPVTVLTNTAGRSVVTPAGSTGTPAPGNVPLNTHTNVGTSAFIHGIPASAAMSPLASTARTTAARLRGTSVHLITWTLMVLLGIRFAAEASQCRDHSRVTERAPRTVSPTLPISRIRPSVTTT